MLILDDGSCAEANRNPSDHLEKKNPTKQQVRTLKIKTLKSVK